jgi:ribosomal protein S27E
MKVKCYECGHVLTVHKYLKGYGNFVTSCIKCGNPLTVNVKGNGENTC